MSFSEVSRFKSIIILFFALFVLSACGGGGGAAAEAPAATPLTCGDTEIIVNGACEPEIVTYQACDDTLSGADTFQTDRYYRSGGASKADGVATKSKTPNSLICTASAYGQIQKMIDDGATNVKQAGEGQVVAILSRGINTERQQDFSHQIFPIPVIEGLYTPTLAVKFTSIFNASETDDGESYEHAGTPFGTNSPIHAESNGANCKSADFCKAGTHSAAIIAGFNGDKISNITGDTHGIAYNAKLKGIVFDIENLDENLKLKPTQITAAIAAASGTGTYELYDGTNPAYSIVAMDNGSWSNFSVATACTLDGSTFFKRPEGLNIDDDCNTSTAVKNYKIGDTSSDLVSNWENVVKNTKTIVVFGTGDQGFNSETGYVDVFSNEGLTEGANKVKATSLFTEENKNNANITGFYGAYPALYDDDKVTAGKWLTVAAIDKELTNKGKPKIAEYSNACGVAMGFCLVAPGTAYGATHTVVSPSYKEDSDELSGTRVAAAHVSGALAVLQAAFPNIKPENLTRLMLETATYIPIEGNEGADETDHRLQVTKADGRTRFTNPVYGYGLLNLAAATTVSKTSYVTASNNESIGVLWTDSSLTLANHFGGDINNVKLGIGDAYGRHFVVAAPQVTYDPVAVGLNDYMAGLLGDNVESETLNPQAQVNYSNSAQSWMNFQYKAGNSTTKLAFQDSYKANPLNAMGETFELRANNIRPASTNIGMMDVDYQLGRKLTLSSYAARGEYDTGYRFDELGTDIDVRHNKSTLNLGIGHLREHEQFLGANTTGAYALREPSISRFTDVTYGHDLGNTGKFNIYANYINYKTDVDMSYQDFADIDNLQADQYQIGFKGKNILTDDDGLNVALITKLGVTDGTLVQNTVMGYTDAGDFNNVTQNYDLAVEERHQQFEVTYQGKLYQNADKVSVLSDNRFFSTIRVEQNLNHQQGVSQTEIIGGMRARF